MTCPALHTEAVGAVPARCRLPAPAASVVVCDHRLDPDRVAKIRVRAPAPTRGPVSLSGVDGQESSGENEGRLEQERQGISPAIVGSGGMSEVSVAAIAYSAQRHGQDAEECIREAVEAGEIELNHKGFRRDYDTYRLAAKGRELHRIHMKNVRKIEEGCRVASCKAAAGQDVTRRTFRLVVRGAR